MCEFMSDYEYSKLFKRRMDKLAEEEGTATRARESRRATLGGFKVKDQ